MSKLKREIFMIGFSALAFVASRCGYRVFKHPEGRTSEFDVRADAEVGCGDPFPGIEQAIAKDLSRDGRDLNDVKKAMEFMINFRSAQPELERLYGELHDELSRRSLFNVVKYRLASQLKGITATITPSVSLAEPRFPLPALKGRTSRHLLQNVYFYSQYWIDGVFEARPGDVVIDAGGYIGDTALYFDSAVQPDGAVYVFEPNRDIVPVLRGNIALNGRRNVTVVEKGLSDEAGRSLLVQDFAGSFVPSAGEAPGSSGAVPIELTTIDGFVESEGLARLDMIKMDIEGLEIPALRGARDSIARFRPKLAISVYHRTFDIIEIPALIRSLNPDYKFYLRHGARNSDAETILFCV
ncbi:MAG: FkbM family methyltransferase [Deltaproteobacteria bacterium]|nr:FkbM family methyltransferase [Deltaproteobacteria bacterium]